MMTQYVFSVDANAQRIPSFWAYRLYAWLLEQVPEEYGEALHQQGETPISQHLRYDRETGNVLWTVNLLSAETEEIFSSILDNLKEINLHTEHFRLTLVSKEAVISSQELILSARSPSEERYRTEMTFLTPASFKKEGRYEIFPSVRLILQSLVNKWNEVCPDFPLEDADALEAMEQGLYIVDYNLRSTRYPLKNIKIPGFIGMIQIESRLAEPLEELWQTLLAIAPYTGIGIKTTLGMGGVCCKEAEKIRRKEKNESY